MGLVPPSIPSPPGLRAARPCCKRGCGAVAMGALASRVMGSFCPDPKTRAQLRSRGGYSLVLHGVAVGFSASAQSSAVASAALSRSGPWEGRLLGFCSCSQSCPRHHKNKQSAVEQERCSGCPGRRQHHTSAAFLAGQDERAPLPAASLCHRHAAGTTDEISKPLHPHRAQV